MTSTNTELYLHSLCCIWTFISIICHRILHSVFFLVAKNDYTTIQFREAELNGRWEDCSCSYAAAVASYQ